MKLLPNVNQPSLATYQALLILYPKLYRQDYGPQMVQVFNDLLNDASRKGLQGVIQLWTHTLIDLVKTAIEERFKGGVRMTKSSFALLSSFLLMVAGVFWLPVSYGQFEQYWEDPFGGPDILFEIGQKFLIPAILLLAIGLFGFALYYAHKLSLTEKISLALSLAAVTIVPIVAATDFFISSVDFSWGWYVLIGGIFVHQLGLIAISIRAQRKPLLPTFNFALLLVSLSFPAYFVFQVINDFLFKSQRIGDNTVSSVFFILMALGWFLIGYAFFKDLTASQKLEPSL